MSNSILSIGIRGVQAGMAKVAESAQKVLDSTKTTSDKGVLDGFIGIKEGQREVQASSKIIKTADEMQDEVLDIIA